MIYPSFKRYLSEQTSNLETISHLPHIGEMLYIGQPNAAIQHLEAMHSHISGKKQQGHALSYKADGKVSIVFGKRNGVPYVKYKGSGSPELYSEKDIHHHIAQTGKTHLLEPFLHGIRAASHPNIDKNSSYQGDVLIQDPNDPDSLIGNIISYKKPRPEVTHAIAVHTHMDTGTGAKIGANPDVSFMETPTAHFPSLSLENKKFKLSAEKSSKIKSHIDSAKKLLKDADVQSLMHEVATHVDPDTDTGNRSKLFVKFSNQVQQGKQPRTAAGMYNYVNSHIEQLKAQTALKEKEAAAKAKAAGKNPRKVNTPKEQLRQEAHRDYIAANMKKIQKLFQVHDHIDAARHEIVQHIHDTGDLPMTPTEGHHKGEGFVSEIAGVGQLKFVPTSFTQRNIENKERFAKVKKG